MNQPEPSPILNDGEKIWNLVISDLRGDRYGLFTNKIVSSFIDDILERDEIGTKKYGTPLKAFNGRDALIDSYQESMDLVVYLRQVLAEAENNTTVWDLYKNALAISLGLKQLIMFRD